MPSDHHNDLLNMQGGTLAQGAGVVPVSDYYHLTAAEHPAVAKAQDHILLVIKRKGSI